MAAELELDPGARHDQLMAVLAKGVRDVCVALWYIREEKTYASRGFKSFGEFLRSLHYSAATGRLWANAGPLVEQLRLTGDDHLISHPDVVRPIALLLAPSRQTPEVQARVIKRQAEIVRRAAALAKKGMEPLTEEVVARVARLNYGVLSRDEYRARNREAKEKTEEERRADMRKHIQLAINVIRDYRRTGFELEREIGFSRLDGFDELHTMMNDALDSREG